MKAHVAKSISSYNEVRPHASCDFLTPNQAHKGSGILLKRWKKNYKKKSMDEIEFQQLAGKKAINKIPVLTKVDQYYHLSSKLSHLD